MDLAIKKGIEINIHISENTRVFADENMLASTIRNLTSNAVKFTPAGGNVNLSAETMADGALKFSVKDSGIGMNAEMVDNLFKLDVITSQRGTDNEQGTGLGLILCKEFIEKHGGELHVESKDGAGSTFHFTLPGNTQPPEIEVTEKIAPVHNSGNQVKALKVLIAEDDETSQMLISIYVKPFSKEILKTTKGTEAIEICRQNPDIDMILMDIMMPEMGGYEATRQIRQFNKKVVIIAQTAFGMTGDREKAIAAGCNDYISKPIKKNELTGLIQKYFGK
jgi:CheY-like chemotaxis protein